MGDRADDAKAASYTAQDLMIVERDVGRLAKYTFDMGGAGDLLSLSLNVPPWEDLHELSRGRIAADQSRHHQYGRRRAASDDDQSRRSGGRTDDVKPVQDRFVAQSGEGRGSRRPPPKSTKTAEALVPTGGVSAAGRPNNNKGSEHLA